MTCLCKAEFCFKCGCRSCLSTFNFDRYLSPLFLALWDTQRRKCTSNPACDSRERERDASTDRVAQVVAKPTLPLSTPPQVVNVFGGAGGSFQPPVHEALRPVVQSLIRNDGGDFGWINNPSTCARFTMAYVILIQSR